MTKDYYLPSEIHFTLDSCLWLIRNLVILRSGEWPPEPLHIDLLHKVGDKAYFETPIQYAAEIELRMERCGVDGLILEAIECWGKTDASLAAYFGFPEWSVRKRRAKALRYVASGPNVRWHTTPKRKSQDYQGFK